MARLPPPPPPNTHLHPLDGIPFRKKRGPEERLPGWDLGTGQAEKAAPEQPLRPWAGIEVGVLAGESVWSTTHGLLHGQ